MTGFPDWQRITEWIGAPLVTRTGFAIGAGNHTDGPFPAGSWASVVLAIKPTGGAITATVRQLVAGGPASLFLDTPIVAGAGAVVIESVPLLAGDVELILQGSAVGETVDYALSPANTTTRSIAVGGGTVITGEVSGAGAKVAGTGYAVNRTAAGTYVVTFDTAFAAPPVVVANVTSDIPGGAGICEVLAKTAAGFTMTIKNLAAVATDYQWDFVAYTMS